MASLRISIIIVNYNVRDLLEACLQSLMSACAGVLHEVIVVDNQSDDGSAAMLRERFPDVRVLENAVNVGFARANNRALAEARGDYLLLLNPDTLVQEDTVQVMLRFMDTHPDTGMAGCRIITPSGALDAACRRSFPSPWISFTKLSGLSALFPRSRLFARYNLTYLNEDDTYEVDAISGSFMLVRRAVYEQIGGLDESYFMYGEDLDWCYRVQKAGWKIHYVHETTIIHYRGESTRRSSIDAQAVFYDAMDLFVRKNLRPPALFHLVIRVGIRLRLLLSRSREPLRRALPVLIDGLLAALSLLVAELVKSGALFRFPSYAYPTVYLVTVAVAVIALAAAGTYTRRDSGFARAATAVAGAFFVLSSLTYFFKSYAFSRFVVLVASALMLLTIAGRRLFALLLPHGRTDPITGRPTLVVGTDARARELLGRLRASNDATYRVTGLIGVTHEPVGEKLDGMPVIGSVDNIAKIIRERRISDVIFAPDILPYADILHIIAQTRSAAVRYRIVPQSMDFLAGSVNVDRISGVPLLDIDYHLLRRSNRFAKRAFDIVIASACLIAFGPFVYFFSPSDRTSRCSLLRFVRELPGVLAGRRSIVGVPDAAISLRPDVYLGRPGLTGVMQLRSPEELGQDEMLAIAMQYARDHSLFLDVEILLRTVALCLRRRRA